jgi:membrane protein YqaA with SNARE-associated domain
VGLSFRHLLTYFLQLGSVGILLVSIADDSFLFLPIGSDLLTVILVARHHSWLPLYVLAGAVGSAIGVFILDLVCRNGGEALLKRLVKPRLLNYLQQRMEKHAAMVMVVTCLAPPPFPFGAAIAVASAFQYPKPRLLSLVLGARTIRYSLIGWAAIYFGRRVIQIADSSEFEWFMGGFIAFCAIGSIASIIQWVRIGKTRAQPA